MPKNVPEPEECELQEDLYHRLALEDTVIRQGLNKVYRDFANASRFFIIILRLTAEPRQVGASAKPNCGKTSQSCSRCW